MIVYGKRARENELLRWITKIILNNDTPYGRKFREALQESLVIKSSLENGYNSKAIIRPTNQLPIIEDYASREQRKTRDALEKICDRGIYTKEEAERIFNQIYNPRR